MELYHLYFNLIMWFPHVIAKIHTSSSQVLKIYIFYHFSFQTISNVSKMMCECKRLFKIEMNFIMQMTPVLGEFTYLNHFIETLSIQLNKNIVISILLLSPIQIMDGGLHS